MSAGRVTFAVCVEPGSHRLEYKAAALFLTMRRNMGALSNTKIASARDRIATRNAFSKSYGGFR